MAPNRGAYFVRLETGELGMLTVVETLEAGFKYLYAHPELWVRGGGSSDKGTYCLITVKYRASGYNANQKSNEFLQQAVDEYTTAWGMPLALSVALFNDTICPDYETASAIYQRALELAKCGS